MAKRNLAATMAGAQSQLDSQVNHDAVAVMAVLQNHWTNLLSTKRLGVEWAGRTWTYQDIWAEYQALKGQFSQALLVRASDWESTKLGPEWYMTVSGLVFGDPDSALSWCVQESRSDDDCFAFMFTHDTSFSAAKHRP
jgi:hypothetical protein